MLALHNIYFHQEQLRDGGCAGCSCFDKYPHDWTSRETFQDCPAPSGPVSCLLSQYRLLAARPFLTSPSCGARTQEEACEPHSRVRGRRTGASLLRQTNTQENEWDISGERVVPLPPSLAENLGLVKVTACARVLSLVYGRPMSLEKRAFVLILLIRTCMSTSPPPKADFH